MVFEIRFNINRLTYYYFHFASMYTDHLENSLSRSIKGQNIKYLLFDQNTMYKQTARVEH